MTENATIRKVLELARWAPSGDNQQTWAFRIDGDLECTVFSWDTREHCIYDLQGHASLIALGALLETIRIAAGKYGLRADIQPVSGDGDIKHEYRVRIETAGGAPASPLADWITTRVVQRRPFSTRALTSEEKSQLEAAAGPRLRVRWFEGFSARHKLALLIFRSAWIRLTTPEAFATHASVIEWRARFSETRIPEKAVGFDWFTARFSEWVLQSWRRVKFANRYLGGTLLPRIQLDYLPALGCGAHFVLLTEGSGRSREDFLETGAAWMRFWLTATALGLQHQPEMTPLIFCEYVRAGLAFSTEECSMVAARSLRGRFEKLLGEDLICARVLGRVGAGRRPGSRSIRRPLDSLLLPAGSRPAGW